jgi:hypothetical protein
MDTDKLYNNKENEEATNLVNYIISDSLSSDNNIIEKTVGNINNDFKELLEAEKNRRENLIKKNNRNLDIDSIVANINANVNIEKFDIDNKPCIQSANIPGDIQKEFIQYLKNNNYSDKSNSDLCNEPFYGKYRDWIKDTFFNHSEIYFNMDISTKFMMKNQDKENQDKENKPYLNFSAANYYHREFVDKTHFLRTKQNFTTNTNLIIYYTRIMNCSYDCGTSIKYVDKNLKWKEFRLLTNNDVVYCIRDCCFLHKTPTSIPVETGPEISRTLIRSYVRLKDGPEYEESLFPSEQDRPEFSYVKKRGGKSIKKRKSRKSKKFKKTKKTNKKTQTKS